MEWGVNARHGRHSAPSLAANSVGLHVVGRRAGVMTMVENWSNARRLCLGPHIAVLGSLAGFMLHGCTRQKGGVCCGGGVCVCVCVCVCRDLMVAPAVTMNRLGQVKWCLIWIDGTILAG